MKLEKVFKVTDDILVPAVLVSTTMGGAYIDTKCFHGNGTVGFMFGMVTTGALSASYEHIKEKYLQEKLTKKSEKYSKI